MTLTGFLLLGLIYYIGSSTSFTFGIGYFTLYRSVFSGLLTGLVLGDAMSGLLAGAVSNLLFIDFTSTGGSLKGDPCLAGILSALLMIKLNLMPAAAVAIAFPVSMLGLILWKYRLVFNKYFIDRLKKEIRHNSVSALKKYYVYLPQGMLLIVSVIFAAVSAWFIYASAYYLILKVPALAVVLNTTGLILLILSAASALLWFKNKYNIVIFAIAYLLSIYFHFDAYLVLIIILLLSAQKRETIKQEKYKASEIKGKDLIKSWTLWMNFTHSCYSYEMLQGPAFSFSMVPIMRKLYRGKKEERENGIVRHLDFFNTEPNVGTAIHGYIIQLEDKRKAGHHFSEAYISDTKKGLMGAVAGMGDFTTQTVIAPILILGMIYGVVRQELSFFILSAIMMAGSVVYLSLKGYFDGFYYGEEGVLRRVNLPMEIKFFRISHKIFVFLLGLVTGETIFRLVLMIGVNNVSGSSAGLIFLVVIFNYLIRKGIKPQVMIITIYILNLLFLPFV
ncbi:MAG: PTS system mannose/fructose/sorbose family transporter subunit IID [Tissierellales bacterium]|nr:PTS system mannose/fructose/sorbose family transporter subunit IID [Tissierellales bacterium]MBN2827107.1 PTS system mannose/fructose/sorbose family transporter subunit IID [Tissierellales bacterium]